ncbi:MAG: aminoacyl-tRNA hydrolase [Ignavibacteria bacterium GWA2_55_25]|nr:MAG: aminoacyl-tRNA hydrolase [Ignavibacteria bacterium GWA2_55_25]
MHCIIGLGNPGKRYDGTRHNIGFEILDSIALRHRARFESGKGDYLIARITRGELPVVLIKPLTYMNESGSAVAEVVEQFGLPLENLLVVCDDFQLPLGQLRVRSNGSDGGHNGLYSIIYHLQSDQFPRLRCGIASSFTPKEKTLMASYVLEPFRRDELPDVQAMIERGNNACLTVIEEGLIPAMNQYNSKPE